MRATTISTAFFAAALASGCTEPPAPVAVGDYCAIAGRVTLRELCAPGELPAIGDDGRVTCSKLTRADAQTLAAEALKFDRRCAGRD